MRIRGEPFPVQRHEIQIVVFSTRRRLDGLECVAWETVLREFTKMKTCTLHGDDDRV